MHRTNPGPKLKLLAFALAIVATPVWAVTFVWDGGHASQDDWARHQNWNPNNNPPPNDGTSDLVFSGDVRLTPDSGTSAWDINSIVFNNLAGAFVIGGGTVTVEGASVTYAISNEDDNLQTINNALILGSSQTWNAGGGQLLFGGTISLASYNLTATGDYNITMSGNISGSGGSLTKTGTGTLILTGTNSYTGGTTVSGGTLQGNTASLQGNITNNATVVFDQATSGTYAGVMSGTGSLTKQNTGTLTLTGANSYTGNTTVSAGTLQLGAANAIADTSAVTVNSGATFALNASNETVGSIAGAGNITLGSYNLSSGGTNASTTFSGNISGSGGSLTKTGTGTLTLTGTNSYTGGTTVSGGTVQGNTTSLQGSITNNAAVVFDQATSGTYAGVMSGTGSLTKQNTGTLTLTGTNSYTGNTTVSAGTLQLGAANAIADTSAVTVNSGATFALNASNETVGSIAGAGNITLGSYNLSSGGTNASTTFSGNISGSGGSLTKTGTGTLTLTGTNSYTGGTTVSGGTLQGNTTSLQGSITNNAAVVFDQATSGTYAGVMSGTGDLTKNGVGTLTLTGANTYSGTTTVAVGTLQLGASNALGSSSDLTLNTSSTMALNGSYSVLVDNFSYADAVLDYGTTGTANAFLFNNAGTGSGILTVTNWESGTDVLAFASGNTPITSFLDGIYFSGIGSGIVGLTGQTVSGYAGTWDYITANVGTTYVWDGGATSGGTQNNLNNNLNWVGDSAPSSGSTTKISFDGTTRLSPDLNFDFTLNSLKFEATAGAFTINPNTNKDFIFAGIVPSLIQLSSNNQVINAPITLNSSTFVETTGSGTLTLGGVVSGSGGFNKIGTGGALVLSGTNTYTGNTLINEGTVTLTNSSGLGSTSAGTTVNAGATLALENNISVGAEALTLNGALVNNSDTNTYAGTISGTGTVTVTTGGLTLSGTAANTYTGATTVSDGTLTLAKTAGLNAVAGNLTIGDGTGAASSAKVQLTNANQIADTSSVTLLADAQLDLNSQSETIGSLASSFSAANILLGSGTLTTGGNNNSTTFAGSIAGTGGLTKTGTGNLTLSGTSTYSGTTSINQGTITLSNASGLGSTAGGTTVSSGATLALQNNISVGAEALTLNGALVNNSGTNTYAGAISGTGTVTVTTGGLTLSGTAANTYTGTTTVNDGTLTLAKTAGLNAVGGNLTIGDGTGAANSAVVQLTNANQIADTAAVTLQSDGRLNLNNQSETVGSIATASSTANIQLGSATLTTGGNNTSTTFAGAIVGTGGLTKTGTGTLTLSGANTYTGTTTVSDGTLRLGASNVIADGSNLTLESGATFNLNGTYSERVGVLSFDNSTVDFGTTGSANYFLISDDGTSGSGLRVANWTSGVDIFGSATNAIATSFLDSIYFTGIGVGIGAELSTGTQVVGSYGSYYVITPIQTFVWDGGQNSGPVADQDNWSKGNNWGGDIAPAVSAGKAIVMAGVVQTTNDMNGAYNIHSLLFRADAGAFTINSSTGDTLTVKGGGIYNASTATQTINTSVALAANQTWNADAGNLVFGGTNITNGAYNLTVTGSKNTTISGIYGSGAGTLTKAGTGNLTLSGTNTYTGTTLVSGGTLTLANSSALGSTSAGTTVNSGATLALQNNISVGAEALTLNGTLLNNSGTNSYAGTISGSGAVTVTTGGLTLSGTAANTYTGATTVNDGTLTLAKTAGLNAIGGNLTIGDGTGAASSAVVQLTNANQIADTAAVTLQSDGRLNLNNQSETVGSIASTSSTANIQLGSATLTTGGTNATTDFAGVIAGTGSLTKTGTGTLTLSGSSANTFTGGLNINDGTVSLNKTAGVNALGASSTVTVGDSSGSALSASLALQADNQLPDSTALVLNSDGRISMGTASDAISTISGTGQIDLGATGKLSIGGDNSSSSFNGSATGSGTLEKLGTGTLTLNTDINYGGTLRLGGGTLLLNDVDLTVTNLVITADTVLDFSGVSSNIFAGTLSFLSTSITLNIINWTQGVDHFYATNWTGATYDLMDNGGATPMSQIVINAPTWSGNNTGWDSFDDQIRPNVPEPSTYGAIFTGVAVGLFWLRRRLRRS